MQPTNKTQPNIGEHAHVRQSQHVQFIFLWEQYKMSFLGEQDEIIRAKTIFMLSLRFIFINLCDDDDDDNLLQNQLLYTLY